MYYTYILQSLKDNKSYTGYTEDLRKRFSKHNSGEVPSTKGRGPGKRYLKNRLKRYFEK